MIKRKKLRVGMIVDKSDQGSLAWSLFERSKLSEYYQIDTLIINVPPEPKIRRSRISLIINEIRAHGLRQFAGRIGYGLIYRLEKAALTRHGNYLDFFESHALAKFHIKKVFVKPTISASGLIYTYSEDELERIKAAGLDVLARFGGGILRGKVLTTCRFGVISFHHADNHVNRGGPPGFWEVFHKEPSTGFIIQRLTEELDGGDVLVKGSIPTSGFYLLNRVRVMHKSTVFMHQLFERIGESNALPAAHAKRPYAYPLFKMPGINQQLRYALYFSKTVVRKIFDRHLGRTNRWGVAYLFSRDWRSAVLRKACVIKNPPNRFLADPFVIRRDDAHFCFVEDFDYSLGRAAISVYKIDKAGYARLGPVIEEKFHLSFPFLLEHGGELYMCPETVQANEIRLYKCVEFPMKWELHKVLRRNTQAVDTCLFEHGGKWWMFTNIDTSDSGDYGSELHAFYSDEFDSEQWTPHRNNPILFDSTCARNGGMILDDDAIYRVFQVQGFDRYGAAMGIARVSDLTEDTYAEEVVADIPAKFMTGVSGTHTFSFHKGLVAVDVVRVERTSH
jgi:hypothetical protein